LRHPRFALLSGFSDASFQRWFSFQITIRGRAAALTFVMNGGRRFFENGRKNKHPGEKGIKILKNHIVMKVKVSKGQENALMEGVGQAILKSRKVKVKPTDSWRIFAEVTEDVWPDTVQKAAKLAGGTGRLESVGRDEPGVRGIFR